MKSPLFIFFLFFLIESSTLFCQKFSMKGQFWINTEFRNNDNYQIGYIPTLATYYKFSQNNIIDLEWAYHFSRTYNSNSLKFQNERTYRGWVRYIYKSIEFRLGLQKIVFGPAQILRPLAWFDNIDIKNPTGHTRGVEAFRIKYFFSNDLSIWAWIIKEESNNMTYGGRSELSTSLGEWGLTIHRDTSIESKLVSQFSIPISGSHSRLGLDYRYDGLLGFWFEGSNYYIEKQNNYNNDNYSLMTIGLDYTIPVGTGLHVLMENYRSTGWLNSSNTNQNILAIMANLSIGMFHQIMVISNFDWDDKNIYNYLQWSSIYDRFSINCMASINPSEVGNSLQLMFIYNH